ncbi:MAG: hypothetical protein VW873_05665, partial [Betaproteobacteria bacterium]
MKFTKYLLVFISVGFLFLSNMLHAADNVQPLQDEVKEWLTLRNLMFGAKAVTSGENSTVRLSVNKDLDDASTVPIL